MDSIDAPEEGHGNEQPGQPFAAYTARRGDYLRDPAMPGLQRQAREAGRGLWAQSGAIEPWKWRYDCWRQRRC
ncbi:nuclease [Bordetella pertussis]|nr:nuclease [Bordetella pertussis]